VCCFYKRSVDLVFDMLKHLSIRSEYCIYMFKIVEDKLDTINENLIKTNKLLAQIEENLRVPNMIEWAKFRKDLLKIKE
jgi:hypothetical protein